MVVNPRVIKEAFDKFRDRSCCGCVHDYTDGFNDGVKYLKEVIEKLLNAHPYQDSQSFWLEEDIRYLLE